MPISNERMAVSHRMQRALAQSGYQQVEAARQADVPRGVIHKAVQRGSVPRDKATRDCVAKVLGVDPAWLWFIGENDEAPKSQGDPHPSESAPAPAKPMRPEPTVQMSAPSLKMDPKGYALVVPHGDFTPLALRNDCLWITPSYTPEAGDRVYVTVNDNEELIAVLSEDTGDKYVLMTATGGRRTLPKTSVTAMHQISGVLS